MGRVSRRRSRQKDRRRDNRRVSRRKNRTRTTRKTRKTSRQMKRSKRNNQRSRRVSKRNRRKTNRTNKKGMRVKRNNRMKHIKKSKRYINISGGAPVISEKALIEMQELAYRHIDKQDPDVQLNEGLVQAMVSTYTEIEQIHPRWKIYCRKQENIELEAAVDKLASQVIDYVTTWQEAGNHLTGRRVAMLPGLSNKFLYRIIANLHEYYKRMDASGFLSPPGREHDSKSKGRIDAYKENIDSFTKEKLDKGPERKKKASSHMTDVVGAAMVSQGSHRQLSEDERYVLDMTAHNAELTAEKDKLLQLAAIDKELKIGLIQAVNRGEVDKVEQLLRDGADSNAKNDKGEPMMYLAASVNSPDCIQLLNEYGADINAPLEKGYTPMMVAANKGNIKALTMLIHLGADATISIKHQGTRKTALDFAQGKHWFDAARALLDPGHATRDAGSLPPLADSVAAREARLAELSGAPGPETEPSPELSPEPSPDASLPQPGRLPLNGLSYHLRNTGYDERKMPQNAVETVIYEVDKYLKMQGQIYTIKDMSVANCLPHEVIAWLHKLDRHRSPLLSEHINIIVAAYRQISSYQFPERPQPVDALHYPQTYHTEIPELPPSDFFTDGDEAAWAAAAASADARLRAAQDALVSAREATDAMAAVVGRGGRGRESFPPI